MKEECDHPTENPSPSAEATGNEPTPAAQTRLKHRQFYYVVILILAIAIVLLVTLLIDRPTDFEDYVRKSGYAGVFLTALIGCASPVWPLPGSWAAFIAAGVGLNPILLGLAAGIGEPIGESTGYMAGYGGQVAVTKVRGYARVEAWMKRHGAITLFLVCAIPNFLTKVAVVCSGALRYPYWKFFPICWAGKTVKSLFFAITGYYFFDATFDFFDRFF
ncbi:MAG: VTT domain-containing protein [Chloroflexi bacterium]|nr:VTT domain-containing protein [Chloroflexota bacterium]